MIDRASPMTSRGCGVMIATVLLCSLCIDRSADAAEINLSDLRGYSIYAEWISNKRQTRVPTSGQKTHHKGNDRYVIQIYISKAGRIFQRRKHYDLKQSRTTPMDSHDKIRSGRGERFKWAPNSTFVHYVIPSVDEEKATYARIVRIALSQSDGSYSCSVRASLALKKGEKQYIRYEPQGLHWLVHSFKARQKSCRVFEGNVFKGDVSP